MRNGHKEEVVYNLPADIPSDPDSVSTLLSGNNRFPSLIPWENMDQEPLHPQYMNDNSYSGENNANIPPPVGAEFSGMEVENDELIELLQILPESVKVYFHFIIILFYIIFLNTSKETKK